MTPNDCERAETLAGAIALDEASESDRTRYRAHLAACAACVDALGGEREIARVMAVVARARDDERWQPSASGVRRARSRRVAVGWRVAGMSLAAAVVAIVGLHLAGSHVVAPAIPAHGLNVAHHVVRLDKESLAALGTTQTSAPQFAHEAESLALGPRSRVDSDAVPLGGHGIRPAPPHVAVAQMRDEGLTSATTVYRVRVDARGTPTACRIEESSGIPAIDRSVCRAALRARFDPGRHAGRAVASEYRDAFVFLRGGSR